MRTEKLVSILEEIDLLVKIGNQLQSKKLNASNCAIVTVSSDYSSSFGMWLRHLLSFQGEICEGFSIEVPYPDEKWEGHYDELLVKSFIDGKADWNNKTLVLVEAGVIKGGTYTHITDYISKNYPNTKVITVAMFENQHSKFKSDIVGKYYNNDTEDLTFWWEKHNSHWK